MTSGLLGHGVAVGVGLALAARLKKQSHRTYILLGDGGVPGRDVWKAPLPLPSTPFQPDRHLGQ